MKGKSQHLLHISEEVYNVFSEIDVTGELLTSSKNDPIEYKSTVLFIVFEAIELVTGMPINLFDYAQR